jgi:hypothetical protein
VLTEKTKGQEDEECGIGKDNWCPKGTLKSKMMELEIQINMSERWDKQTRAE